MKRLGSVASDTVCWQVLVPLEQNSTYSSFMDSMGKRPASLSLQAPAPGAHPQWGSRVGGAQGHCLIHLVICVVCL